MSIDRRPQFRLTRQDGNCLQLDSDLGAVARLWVLEQDIVRLQVLPDGVMRCPRSWAIAPGGEDVPDPGRDRLDCSGFALPAYALEAGPAQIRLTTAQIRLTVRLDGLHCHWETRVGGDWRYAASDRYTQAWNFGWWDHRACHYLQRDPDDMYFGLGERSGELDRAGQRYRMVNLDAMGYDARSSDPLYKHIPFYITWKPSTRVAYGLFYDTTAECTFDLGRELDNYHGLYRSFVAEHGDVDLWFVAGDSIAAVVRRQTWLTGRPALMPRWSLGWSGSTMAYTEAPDAQQRMAGFLRQCEAHDIPCGSFHLSSGYTTRGDRRYVFHWNRERFPDPEGFIRGYLARGVRLCANVKPCLLQDHPDFAALQAEGLLVRDAQGAALLVEFWGGPAACIDFTHPGAAQWWKARVKSRLLEAGVAAIWNDNNEYEIWDAQATIHGFGSARRAVEARPLQTLLMMRASRAAQQEHAPGQRPFLVSRSGMAGMQRYVQTWSGDNRTSWETLRYNLRMGLGLALSGISNSGHDVGGFCGPRPDPELFLRWIQHGIFMPRFCIHSCNDDGSASEPWMYPAQLDHVRALFRLRSRLIPYLYTLAWRAHTHFEPVIRPTFLDFPDDPECFRANDDMLLGEALLVASVVRPGAQQREVWLPRGSGWYDWWSGAFFSGGQAVRLPAPWDQPPLLAREGSVVALNLAPAHFGREDDRRGFALFPRRQGRLAGESFEDDGESEAWRGGSWGAWRVEAECRPDALEITVSRHGARPPAGDTLELLLPQGETRPLHGGQAAVLADELADGWRRVVLAVR